MAKQDAANKYWDDSAMLPLLVLAAETGRWSAQLINAHKQLVWGLLSKSQYRSYPYDDKLDMASEATLDLIRYGHNFDLAKARSKTPAFSFLTQQADNAFRRYLARNYYRHVNIANTCDAVADILYHNDIYSKVSNYLYEQE